ncbi:MAG: serine/threonine protein kinase, partial [Sandaracinaceae bacterium]|nr:serine/threonine protein kinase [Sandaracinaceae bacterium]
MTPPLLAGRYAYLSELGRGASGRVLAAEDRVAGGLVAIKVVAGPEAEHLRWEARLLGSLAHESLARVYEVLTLVERVGPPWSLEPGAVALVEEHVEGATAGVAAAAIDDASERLRFAVLVGGAVARALGAVHAAGLVHQDVKPGNVVVPTDPARARLIDLGLCRPPGHGRGVSGTLGFLAPEALLGERTAATDLYALGATLFALIVGRAALDTQGSRPGVADALARRPSVEQLPPEVPLSARRLVGDLLADRPDARPESAREVALRLAALAQELGLEQPVDAGLSAAPSGAERAARAGVRPLVGRDEELRA